MFIETPLDFSISENGYMFYNILSGLDLHTKEDKETGDF